MKLVVVIALICGAVLMRTPTPAPAAGCWPFFCRPQRHHPAHHRGPRYDPAFCEGIITAFNQLPPRDLDVFVKSIPPGKRQQARRCRGER